MSKIKSSTVALVKTRPMETESYELVVKVDPSLMDKQSITNYVHMPWYQFEEGILKGDYRATLGCTIYRHEKLLCLSFALPTQSKDEKHLRMISYEYKLISNNGEVVHAMLEDFGTLEAKSGAYSRYGVEKHINLNDNWNDNVDTIKIIWNILVEPVPPSVEFGTTSSITSAAVTREQSIIESMGELCGSDFLSDVTISCQNQDFPSHRWILSCWSPVFKKIFESEFKENKEGRVVIEDMDFGILQIMVQWMYKGEFDLAYDFDSDVMIPLYKAAHRYCINSLKNLCISRISEHLGVENALDLYILGDTYDESGLKEKAFETMKTNRATIFEDKTVFQDLFQRYPDLVHQLLLL